MSTTRVDLAAERGTEEILSPEFYSLCKGVWVEDQADGVVIKSYPSDVDLFLSHIRRSGLSVRYITVVSEQEKDYVAQVRRHFTPVRIGKLTILPPWRKTGKKGPTLIIDPGMAFGTGRHESTKLMIKMMDEIDIEDKRVLDIGSGSGILALYAHLLGASRVVAIDHDPLAAEAAKKSCLLNKAPDILVACSHLESIKGSFQVVLANLDFDTFRLYVNDVLRLLEDGGYLIVSGIEKQYAARIPALFGSLALVRQRRMRDWHGFVFRADAESQQE